MCLTNANIFVNYYFNTDRGIDVNLKCAYTDFPIMECD